MLAAHASRRARAQHLAQRVSGLPRLLFFQPNSGELDPLYVVEVLLRCSRESLENSATEAAKPAKPDEKGEMQVRSVIVSTCHTCHV